MSFLDELAKGTNLKRTENNAVTNESTLDPLLDFFAMAGAMRNNKETALKLFKRAFIANPQGAVRTMFYLRDIREGQGERDLFRAFLRELATHEPAIYNKVVKFVPEYGRWDDLVPMAPASIDLIRAQLTTDQEAVRQGKSPSLLAKWLPSENTSSTKTSAYARALVQKLGLKRAEYRRVIVALRKQIKLLEQQMSAKDWANIDYAKLPSQAHRKHIKAFKRHDEARYDEYLNAVMAGKTKMNANTIATYEVFDTIATFSAMSVQTSSVEMKATNTIWEKLPDYTRDSNAIVIADVSGSMSGRPMSVAVSLALYFAEHNKGAFNGYFMTFSARPQLVKVVGNTLADKLAMIANQHWDMNTDLEAALEAILYAAMKSGEKSSMPKTLYIISDMEFDMALRNPNASIFDNAKALYAQAGYELPHVVFWNVDARQTNAPATKFDSRVTLISGMSQTTFAYVVEGKTPIDLMNEVINGKRYAQIVL